MNTDFRLFMEVLLGFLFIISTFKLFKSSLGTLIGIKNNTIGADKVSKIILTILTLFELCLLLFFIYLVLDLLFNTPWR